MRNFLDDPLWWKKIKVGEIWVKKAKFKKDQLFEKIKIVSVINLKNKKAVKIQILPEGRGLKVQPGWIFYNYEKVNNDKSRTQ